jgi:hypothetical protein
VKIGGLYGGGGIEVMTYPLLLGWDGVIQKHKQGSKHPPRGKNSLLQPWRMTTLKTSTLDWMGDGYGGM